MRILTLTNWYPPHHRGGYEWTCGQVMKHAPAELSMNFIRAIVGRLRQANSHFVEEMLRNERLSLVGRMSSSIVHDFKKPRATSSSACQRSDRHTRDAKIASFTDAIERSVQQMLGMTQELFAARYGLTLARVRDWEQGRSAPDGAVRAYLKVIEKEPKAVERALARA